MSNHVVSQILMFSAEALATALLLLWLFRMRTRLGLFPLYVTLGVFQPIQVLLASSIYVEIVPGLMVSPGSVIMFTASLFAILLVYIREDAIEARKVIYGIVVANLIMTLLLLLFGMQLRLPGTLNFLSLPREIFNQGARVMVSGTFALFIDVILIIFVYEGVRSFIPRSPFLRIYLSMVIVLTIDTIVFATGAFYGQPNLANMILSGIYGKTCMAVFYAAALTLYLRFVEPVNNMRSTTGVSQPFHDIFYALTYREKYELEKIYSKEVVHESEKKFSEVIEQSVDGLSITDEEGSIIAWNRSLFAITGLTAEEMIGKTTWDEQFQMMPKAQQTPEEYNRLKGEMLDYFSTANLPSRKWELVEQKYTRPDGVQLFIQRVMFPIKTNKGAMLGSIVRDVTEHKQAVETLHIYENIVSTTQDLMSFIDRNYVYRAVNDAYCHAHGKRREEIVNHGVEELLGREVFLVIQEKLDSVLNGEKIHYREWFDYHVTGRRYMEITYYPYIDENDIVAGIVVNVHDLTGQRKIETQLRKSTKEWEQTFDAMQEIVTIQDHNFRIIRANRAAYDLFQMQPGEMDGRYCYEFFQGASEPCPGCPAMETVTDGSNASATITHEKLGKVFQISTSNVLDENQEPQFLVHIAQDITEQQRLEEELFQAHKMEAVGTLAGGIAHDFNNILAGIIGSAELAKMNVNPNNTTVGKDLDQIITSGLRASELVKQILTFSRKSDRLQVALQPHLIVTEALKMLHSTFPSSITIIEDIDTECGSIVANPTSIHQIIMNLCTNALQSMKDEKGTLTVRMFCQQVGQTQLLGKSGIRPGLFVVLTVTDTGCGMDEATIDRTFEPYFTTKEQGGGTGLGLSVIHGIVQNCRGFIEVKSSVGKGSTFSVFLPVTTESVIRPADPTTKGKGRRRSTGGDKKKILVVDDEPLLANIYQKQLERWGYRVTAVTESEDALELFRRQPEEFDLLITDQAMPGLTGEDLVLHILKIKPTIPIIMCTGHSETVSEEKALAMGIKKYVFKPLNGEELIAAIQEVLDEN